MAKLDERPQDTTSEPPSPYLEDFVLSNPDGDPSRRMAALQSKPNKIQLIQAIHRTFETTGELLAHDRKFGSLIPSSRVDSDERLYDMVDDELAMLLDRQ